MTPYAITLAELIAAKPCKHRLSVVMAAIKSWPATAAEAFAAGLPPSEVLWIAVKTAHLRKDADLRRRVLNALADIAERVLPIYEKKFPGDMRPRDAVVAARRCADGESGDDRNRSAALAALAAANSAYAAADSAYAAADARLVSRAAASAAYDAADAAYAALAARSASRAAASAAYDAADAAYAADVALAASAASAAYDAADAAYAALAAYAAAVDPVAEAEAQKAIILRWLGES